MRSIFSVWVVGLAVVAGGCATQADVNRAVDESAAALRAENQAEATKLRAELKASADAVKADTDTKVAALGQTVAGLEQRISEGQEATRKDLAAQREATDAALAELKAQLAREVEALTARLTEIDQDVEATAAAIAEVREQTAGIATQMAQVKEEYLASLRWEAEHLQQRLEGLQKTIASLGGTLGEGAAAPEGDGAATEDRK